MSSVGSARREVAAQSVHVLVHGRSGGVHFGVAERGLWQQINIGNLLPRKLWRERDGISILAASSAAAAASSSAAAGPADDDVLRMAASTVTSYTYTAYRLVVVIDASASMLALDAHTYCAPFSDAAAAFGPLFAGLARPMRCGASTAFAPDIFVSVLLVPPPHLAPPSLVVHGFDLDVSTAAALTRRVRSGMRRWARFWWAGGPLASAAARPALEPLIEIAVASLKLLPGSACPAVLVVTDGVAPLEACGGSTYASLSLQLCRHDVALHCLQVGSCSGVHGALGCAPDSESLQHLCSSTGGFLLRRRDVEAFTAPRGSGEDSASFSTASWSALQVAAFVRTSVLPRPQFASDAAASSRAADAGSTEASPGQASAQSSSLLPVAAGSTPGGVEGTRLYSGAHLWAPSLLLASIPIAATPPTDPGNRFPWSGLPPLVVLTRLRVATTTVRANPHALLACRLKEGFRVLAPEPLSRRRQQQLLQAQAAQALSTQLVLQWQPQVLLIYSSSPVSPDDDIVRVTIDLVADSHFTALYAAITFRASSSSPVTAAAAAQVTRPLSRLSSSAVGAERARQLEGLLRVIAQTDVALAHLCTQPPILALPVWSLSRSDLLLYAPFGALSSSAWHRWLDVERIEVTLPPGALFRAGVGEADDLREGMLRSVTAAVALWAHAELPDARRLFTIAGTGVEAATYERSPPVFLRLAADDHVGGSKPFLLVRVECAPAPLLLAVVTVAVFASPPPARAAQIALLRAALGRATSVVVQSGSLGRLLLPLPVEPVAIEPVAALFADNECAGCSGTACFDACCGGVPIKSHIRRTLLWALEWAGTLPPGQELAVVLALLALRRQGGWVLVAASGSFGLAFTVQFARFVSGGSRGDACVMQREAADGSRVQLGLRSREARVSEQQLLRFETGSWRVTAAIEACDGLRAAFVARCAAAAAADAAVVV